MAATSVLKILNIARFVLPALLNKRRLKSALPKDLLSQMDLNDPSDIIATLLHKYVGQDSVDTVVFEVLDNVMKQKDKLVLEINPDEPEYDRHMEQVYRKMLGQAENLERRANELNTKARKFREEADRFKPLPPVEAKGK